MKYILLFFFLVPYSNEPVIIFPRNCVEGVYSLRMLFMNVDIC